MKRFQLFCVVALLGAAVSAPAQISIEGRLGNFVRGTVVLGHHDNHGNHSRSAPVRRAPVHLGHWQTVCEQVLVPGYWQEQPVPPTYGWVYHCGHFHWGIVEQGGCRRVWVPARWETRSRQVWVPC